MTCHLHTFSLAAVAGLALLAGAPAAQAVEVNLLELTVKPAGGVTYHERIVQPGHIEAAGVASGTNGATGQVAGSVDWGVIKLSGHALSGTDTQAFGMFNDVLTLTSPQVANGSVGVLTYEIAVTGSMSAGSVGNSSWSLMSDYHGDSQFEINRRGVQFNDHFFGDPITTYSGSTVVTFGDPARLSVRLSAGAVGNASFFDLGQSLYWGGVTNLRVNGIAITEFTLSSESGTDYTHSMVPVTAAVPEPASVALLLAGLGLMLAWRRPRRSR